MKSIKEKEYAKKYYNKYKQAIAMYYQLIRLSSDDKFIDNAYQRIQMSKWRKANPIKALELGKRYQKTWRYKNPDLNRERSKYGMRNLNMYRDIIKLSGVKV